ncbi:MAG: DUF4340 domain-containing protein [Opitutaceae bacterium]|nr:DUF4340 domain-containing protein [Opitutaceae bacterium]
MRTKITLVLLFLNVILFYYIFHFEKKWEEERKYQEARRRVLPLEVASIDSFTRTTRTGAVIRLEKRGDTWWLTQPYEWPANLNAVSSITTELNFLEHETSFAVRDLAKSGQSLADYGLDQPALTFAFTAAGRNYTLKIGDDTKFGHRLYVLSPDGARVHVVSRHLAEIIGLPVESFRTESVFSIPPFEARSLSLQTTALKVRLRRDGPRWLFEAPIITRADKNKVDVTISALKALQARKFFETRESADLATGLDNPILRVTLEGNARREALLIGQPVPGSAGLPPSPAAAAPPAAEIEHYALLEDNVRTDSSKSVVFTVALPSALLEDLTRAQETLRDARLLDFDPRTVTALTLLAPNAPNQPELTLQRLESAAASPAPSPGTKSGGGDNWQLIFRANGQNARTLPADAGIVQDLLQKLYLLTAKKFLSDAPADADVENYGLKSPDRQIHLKLAGDPADPSGVPGAATEFVLQIGTSPGQRGSAYARLTNPLYIYQIDRDILRDTVPLLRHFREHTRELPAGAKITSLKLTDLATGTVLLDRALPADSTLPAADLAGEDDPAPRKTALLNLLAELRVLRAKRFVADTFTEERAEPANGAPQEWKYRLDATLALVGGSSATPASSIKLFFTERLGGTTQLVGTTEFDGVVFEANQALLDAIFALTYGPQDPGPPDPEPAPTAPPAAG